MPTTYTTDLRLVLPADGEDNGTWGDLVNNGITTLVDQAVSGFVSVAMSDADRTLTALNGASDEARNAIIYVTGANTAQRKLIPPLVSKLYTIYNNTTGGFGINFIGVSGTGVVIPNGKQMLVFCDGTNCFEQFSFTYSDAASADKWSTARTITLTGNVTGVSGGFDGSANLSFATTIPSNTVTPAMLTTGHPTWDGSSNLTIGGTLGVTGTSTIAALSATSGTFSSTLGVTGALTATGGVVGNSSTATTWATGRTITMTGNVTGVTPSINGSASVSFATTIAAGVVAPSMLTTGHPNWDASSNLTVAGAITVSTGIGVTGGLTTDTISASGSTSIAALTATTGSFSSTLAVTGASTIHALSATSGTFSTTLGVTGATTISSLSATSGTFSTTLGVTGATTLSSLSATSGTFSTTLGVAGATTLSSTLGVAGATTLGSLSATSGAFSTTLGVTGAATLSSTLAVTGAITATGGVVGNASTATTAAAWTTGRTLTLTGNVTGVSGAIDGSANVSFSTAIAAGVVSPAMLTTGHPTWDASSNLTVAGALTVTGAVSTGGNTVLTNVIQAPGTATNDSATAGNLGEEIQSAVSGRITGLTSGSVFNITSILLTPGDWDVDGSVGISSATGTTVASFSGAISTANNSLPTLGQYGTAAWTGSGQINGIFGVTIQLATSKLRVSIAAPTTYYLNCSQFFSGGTAGGFGNIVARRVR